MPTDNIDSKYLKDTVADVLVRACSECAVARPMAYAVSESS